MTWIHRSRPCLALSSPSCGTSPIPDPAPISPRPPHAPLPADSPSCSLRPWASLRRRASFPSSRKSCAVDWSSSLPPPNLARLKPGWQKMQGAPDCATDRDQILARLLPRSPAHRPCYCSAIGQWCLPSWFDLPRCLLICHVRLRVSRSRGGHFPYTLATSTNNQLWSCFLTLLTNRIKGHRPKKKKIVILPKGYQNNISICFSRLVWNHK